VVYDKRNPVTAAQTVLSVSPASLGPIQLQPSVSQLNVLALVYGNFMTIGALVFVSIGQTYVLNANLGVPLAEQGAIGIMAFAIVGGRLFDSFSPAAPFMLVGAGTAVVMLAGIVVRLKSPGRMSVHS
jgi:hypothetical protein